MIDFKEMDEKYIVRYDESKSCMFAYLWSKKDWPCYKDGKKGLWDGDFGWISVSEAYSYMKDKGYHFYPAGRYKETYVDAYKLNETFGECTDDRVSLYLIGKGNKAPWTFTNSIGNISDTRVEWVNRERKLANYLLGFITEDEITDADSTTSDKNDIIRVLQHTKALISTLL